MWHIHGGINRLLFLFIEHVNGDTGRQCTGVDKVHRLVRAEQILNMQLRIGEGGQVGTQHDPPNQLAFPEVLLLGGDFGHPIPLHFWACALYLLW